jgi:hypothetical protein
MFLKTKGLPIPDFIKIESVNELCNPFFKSDAPHGWTIRTCKKNGKNEISLFNKNQISIQELIETLKERLFNNPDEFYIIYHSWAFYFSFNMIRTKYQYIIEGNFGSQKSISSENKAPTFSLTYNRLAEKFSQTVNFPLDNSVISYINKAIQYMKAIHFENDYYTEVAVTRDKELFFYELWFINYLSDPVS